MKRKSFTVTLSGTIPRGCTLAQVRAALKDHPFDLDVDFSDYRFDHGNSRAHTIKLRPGVRVALKAP